VRREYIWDMHCTVHTAQCKWTAREFDQKIKENMGREFEYRKREKGRTTIIISYFSV
jgi:hypothetical protein